MTFRGDSVPLPSAIQILGLALLIAATPAHAKKKHTPTPTPSTLPPTSPMLAVPEAGTGGQQPDKLINSDMSGRDLEFLTEAVDSGRTQAFLIDLLHTRASSDEIKKLAENLSIAQDNENKHIVALAAKKGWNVSMNPTPALKKSGADLEKLEASNFDKAAMDKLVGASESSLAAYKSAVESTDPDIKTFAAQMIPLAEEKGHVVEKMTGAGAKTAAQLFRHSASPSGSSDNATPKSTPPVAEPPADSSTPATTPGATPAAAPAATPAAVATATPKPTKSGRKGKHTPKPGASPTPADSVPSDTTSPGRPALPRHTPQPAAPPTDAGSPGANLPIPSTPAPSRPSSFSLPVATPAPTLK
jgi:predicted outer membrane protein